MKKWLCLFFLLVSFNLYSQSWCYEKNKLNFSLKEEYPSLITTFMGGAFEGTAEILKWHYYRFQNVFPNANKNFWDPKYSGDNKYKDGLGSHGPKYFGSTTFLVWTTDGYHALRSSRNIMFATTISLHSNSKRKKWYDYAFDLGVHALVYQAGFHSTYSLLFK